MSALCRFCKADLNHIFVDLGSTPLSNAYIKPEHVKKQEPAYPLCVYVCSRCLLVQIEEFESREAIFSPDYAYHSSCSTTWLDHSRAYADATTKRFGLTGDSHIMEVASNDGYLLQFFKEKGMRVCGIEPAHGVANIARMKGIPTITEFFGKDSASTIVKTEGPADLIVANNVLAHVPDINDFVKGFKIALAQDGVITVEFPHVLNLIEHGQFDTIYHEHFSYLSLYTVEKIFQAHGLEIFDVEEIFTHGGSLRVYAKHIHNASHLISHRVHDLKLKEESKGLFLLDGYLNFGLKVQQIKQNLLSFLNEKKQGNMLVAGYGAPAKGNTLLNYCGISRDLLSFTVDLNVQKQGCYLPGSKIPIWGPEKIEQEKPDYILILPWNLRDEIVDQLSYVRRWGAKFVIPLPKMEII